MNLNVEFLEVDHTFEVDFGEVDRTLEADFGEIIDNTREPIIEPLRVTENGEYNVGANADGFNPVIVDVIGGNVEEYKGAYEVTPKLEAQTLPTASKVMRHNVEVKEIPITKVTNTSGGNTVIIGG